MQRSTSDLKTRVGRDFIDELATAAGLTRPPRAGYALGMRAEESTNRAKKPALERHRMSGAGRKREVTTWLPIHSLTESQVWRTIHERRLPYHEAYDMGMRRLSCRLCPLAADEDLARSAHLNPELAAEYERIEKAMGEPFKKGTTMTQLIDRALQQH
ncbi:phosphoadenosine phosphosulfate reductase domain-containing protein [Streptomyces smyrnaeus]|uniref:phosphoadenosine phosphosulfate reductase domain-containing protein n=1 Tax=Streptomyces smyrnaeus TaxID=1387713 RepID=UPI000C3A79E7